MRETVQRILGNHRNIILLEPLDTASFHNLMQRCRLILTDSGGIQEEAPSLGRPVLVLREITERPEAVEAGTVKVVGTTEEPVYRTARHLLEEMCIRDSFKSIVIINITLDIIQENPNRFFAVIGI